MSDQPETESRRQSIANITPKRAQDILGRIASGESVRRIALSEGISERTLRYWVAQGEGVFAGAQRAKEEGMDSLAEQCLDIADDPGIPSDQKRVRIDTRLRLLGKWSRRYADKQQVELSVRPAHELTDDELARIASSSGAIAPPSLADESA